MTVKSKKILAGMAASAVLAVTALSAAAATPPPSGARQWKGSVPFSLTHVDTMTKNNDKNTSYMSYNGGPDNVNIWLRSYTYIDGKEGEASSRNFFKRGDGYYVGTGAVRGCEVRLYANHENFWDIAANVSGLWLA